MAVENDIFYVPENDNDININCSLHMQNINYRAIISLRHDDNIDVVDKEAMVEGKTCK